MAYPHIDTDFLLKRVPESVLVELTDDAGTGTIDSDVLAQCIADAADEFYAIITGHYPLPLTEDFPLARLLIRDIAMYNVYARRHSYQMPEEISKQYDRAVSKAMKITKGELSLDADHEESPATATVRSNKTARDRKFPSRLFRGGRW